MLVSVRTKTGHGPTLTTMWRTLAIALLVASLVAACSPEPEIQETQAADSITTTTRPESTTTTIEPSFSIASPAFQDGDVIPTTHTCDGDDVSPELVIVGIPDQTETLTLIVDDPDAPVGTWDHWVEFDVLPDESGRTVVPEGVGTLGAPGVNSWNLEGYKGPCPPTGQVHLYYFTVFALDTSLDLPAGVTSSQVRAAMEGHILETTRLSGSYSR